VINYSHSMPILQNFKFEITDTLKITATDLDTTLSCVIEATGEGSLCIPAKLIIDALKALPNQPIDLSSEGSVLMLTAKSGKYKLPCTDASEFPQSIIIAEPRTITLPAEILAEGINKTVFVTADDQLRPAICGVLFRMSLESLVFAATDMFRIATYTRRDVKCTSDKDIIIHKKPLNFLKNILSSGDVVLSYNDINAQFVIENLEFTTRLIDSKYVNYEGVIPKENPYRVVVSKDDILGSIKRVSLFANLTSKQIILDIKENSIKITSSDIDFSTDAEENVSCEYNGLPIRIGFNYRYFIDLLSSMQCIDVIIEMSAPNRAAILTHADSLEEDESAILLLSPQAI